MIKKILATLISCFILVSFIVIYYWRDTQYQPEYHDLIQYFIGLPLLITFIMFLPWLVYQAYQAYKNKKQQALQQQQDSNPDPIQQTPVVQQSVWLTLNLYASNVYSALGENEAILDGIKQFTSPQLDQQLVNAQGLPILSYRIEELTQRLDPDHAETSMTARQQRTMALIDQQIELNTEMLLGISDHLKRSSLFYESQNLHEYRMHPAWIDPSISGDDEKQSIQVEQVYRLDKLNLYLLFSEDVIHTWDDHSSNEHIQSIFYELGIIPQKFHIEYHYVSTVSASQQLVELLKRIENQPHEISLIIAVDSEIDQDIVDEKSWGIPSYIPAEFVGSCCVAHPAVQLEQIQPFKTLKLVSNQNNLTQILKELNIPDLAQYEDEQPFVLVVEDSTDLKVVKKLEHFFAESPVEQHHYLYCKPVMGNTQNLAKIFGLMLGAHLPEPEVAFIYGQDLKAFIQNIPGSEMDQEYIAVAN